MTDTIQRLNDWLSGKHADYVAIARRLPTVGSLFGGLGGRWDRENDEQHRRVKALDAVDEGMADRVGRR